MIRIPIKNGDIDSALAKFKTAKKEQDRAFEEKVAGIFSKKPKQQQAEQQQPQQKQEPKRPAAPSYQTILARSRRLG
ncbi:MAG: hypothetical protein WC670_18130 [Pseudolabrys sp.]